MSSKQTRRSISFRYWSKARIELYAKDHGMTTSAYLESLVRNKLGEPTPEELAAYTPPVSQKIGHDSEPVPKPKRPTVNQPKPEPKPAKADDEDVPSELKNYVKPLQFF